MHSISDPLKEIWRSFLLHKQMHIGTWQRLCQTESFPQWLAISTMPSKTSVISVSWKRWQPYLAAWRVFFVLRQPKFCQLRFEEARESRSSRMRQKAFHDQQSSSMLDPTIAKIYGVVTLNCQGFDRTFDSSDNWIWNEHFVWVKTTIASLLV